MQFVAAKKAADAGDTTKLKAFINLVLAEPWEEQGDRADHHQLAKRVETMILAVAALSFLGLGVQPPTPSWGSMLYQGKEYFYVGWWMTVFPGIIIATMVFGINLFGDGLRDYLNPRRR